MKNLLSIVLLVMLEFLSGNAIATDVWNQKPNLPTVGRHRGTGIAIGNKGYIGLGHVNGTGVNVVYSDWWEYDPATASWTQKSDFPVQTYGVAAFATTTAGYVGGGIFQDKEFYKFNPALNTWTAVADAPEHVNDNIAFCIGRFGYISAGDTIYEYDTANDTWSQKQSPPSNINIWSSATVLQNSAYIKTGSNFYEYKPASDTWITKAAYPGFVNGGGVAFSANNKCYFLLGYSGSLGNVQKEMWEYDPANNSWTMQPEFPGTSRRFSCAFSINDVGYLGTGTNGINFNDFWEYNRILTDPESVARTAVKTFPSPANQYVTFELGPIIENKYVHIIIYNMQGKQLTEISSVNGQCTLDVSNYPSGNYLYAIIDNKALVNSGLFIKR